jgi:NTE family protein
MIGLALSGGGSRAIAFHLGCLRALKDLGLLGKIDVMSTISGGSVIGAYYAYTPERTFEEFDGDIRRFLRIGFERAIVARLGNPRNLVRCLSNLVHAQVDAVSERVLKRESKFRDQLTRTDLFSQVLHDRMFANLWMSSPRRNVEIVIGACEMRTASAFRFGNARCGSWRFGDMVDWDVNVAFAVAASAAYPLLLPAVDRKWKFRQKGVECEHRVLLTDGGVYDNLGVQVLEPGRDPKISIHTFPCDYLIVCNAGHGQASGTSVPSRFLSRVSASFEIIHRRVQDAAMHRLHELERSRTISGFVLPYLGQQDDRLPWKPTSLVERAAVIEYPTNFSAMSTEWIDKLSARGEQLTRALTPHYLPQLFAAE